MGAHCAPAWGLALGIDPSPHPRLPGLSHGASEEKWDETGSEMLGRLAGMGSRWQAPAGRRRVGAKHRDCAYPALAAAVAAAAAAAGVRGRPSCAASSGETPGVARALGDQRLRGGACPGRGRRAEPRSVGARRGAQWRGSCQVPSFPASSSSLLPLLSPPPLLRLGKSFPPYPARAPPSPQP